MRTGAQKFGFKSTRVCAFVGDGYNQGTTQVPLFRARQRQTFVIPFITCTPKMKNILHKSRRKLMSIVQPLGIVHLLHNCLCQKSFHNRRHIIGVSISWAQVLFVMFGAHAFTWNYTMEIKQRWKRSLVHGWVTPEENQTVDSNHHSAMLCCLDLWE